MPDNYFSKKLDRVISARNNVDKWAVDHDPAYGFRAQPYIAEEDLPRELRRDLPRDIGVPEKSCKRETLPVYAEEEKPSLLQSFAVDDILLMALILVLLLDENGKDNIDLILVLAFLLIMGFE